MITSTFATTVLDEKTEGRYPPDGERLVTCPDCSEDHYVHYFSGHGVTCDSCVIEKSKKTSNLKE
tara:strand:+ start:500 stop:694 length:195 start_codon:yes stop_codon:yes gene_type:complete